jgi:ubiquinol oxidase
LGRQQFMRNWRAILGEYSDEPPITFSSRQMDLQKKLKQLKLNSTEIWERELANGPIEAPFAIKIPYLAICYLLDAVFEGGFVPARFFLLETVARMPYFSYISMLHLYETLGFWRRSTDAKRIHFAEELNEFAHLTIMESLGGDQTWWVRFIAQHSAIFYYFLLCGLFAISPSLSYRFSELLETHAVNTYSVFLDNNEVLLKELPPTNVAVNYYSLGLSDPFYAEFQTSPIVGHEVSFFVYLLQLEITKIILIYFFVFAL